METAKYCPFFEALKLFLKARRDQIYRERVGRETEIREETAEKNRVFAPGKADVLFPISWPAWVPII